MTTLSAPTDKTADSRKLSEDLSKKFLVYLGNLQL